MTPQVLRKRTFLSSALFKFLVLGNFFISICFLALLLWQAFQGIPQASTDKQVQTEPEKVLVQLANIK